MHGKEIDFQNADFGDFKPPSASQLKGIKSNYFSFFDFFSVADIFVLRSSLPQARGLEFFGENG